ncbi:LexA family transcriptional regulator [Streptococcus sp. SGI.013]
MKQNERMTEIAKNISFYRKKAKLTQKSLAEKVGIKPSTLSDYIHLRSTPSFTVLQALAQVFSVHVSDIDTAYKSTPHSDITEDIMKTLNHLNHDNQEKVLSYANTLRTKSEEKIMSLPSRLYDIQTVTKLSAGRGYSYDDYETQTVQVQIKPPSCDLASIVSGDSMSPDYCDGDVVFLTDKGLTTYTGQVCAIAYDDETYIKKVYSDKYGLKLVSINPIYDDIYIDFPLDEDSHLKIYVVVGSAKVVR